MSSSDGRDGSDDHAEHGRPVQGDKRDILLVHSRTEDGAGLRALRARQGRLEGAELRPLASGQPLNGGEIVSLRPREESPLLFDVEETCQVEAMRAGAGPPLVANERYRCNWEVIFGGDDESEPEPEPNDYAN